MLFSEMEYVKQNFQILVFKTQNTFLIHWFTAMKGHFTVRNIDLFTLLL